jgi:transcriptional regulator with XRE-family HTH domain
MSVYTTINLLLRNKNCSKREFSNLLRALQPKLKSTGNIPTEKTIYKYLSGEISIPIELIPYIANALDIPEQKLFEPEPKIKHSLNKYLHQAEDKNQLTDISTLNHTKSSEKNLYLNDEQTNRNELMDLLDYAPPAMVKNMILQLKQIKSITLSG